MKKRNKKVASDRLVKFDFE